MLLFPASRQVSSQALRLIVLSPSAMSLFSVVKVATDAELADGRPRDANGVKEDSAVRAQAGRVARGLAVDVVRVNVLACPVGS